MTAEDSVSPSEREIEAVALDAVLDDFLPRYVYRWEHIPNKQEHRDWWRREFERLIPIYRDRVREARVDDEGTMREGLQRILDLPCPLGREGDWLGKAQRIASETISAAARSPQGEDHET